jgi:hypothetical protein
MIRQVHILTTYMCTMSCEHCFVCSSPNSQGTFTPSQVSALLDQVDVLGTVDTIYFGGVSRSFSIRSCSTVSARPAAGDTRSVS